MQIPGCCHCGNIQYEFKPTMDIKELPVRRCRCSFCSRHGASYTSDPHATLTITIKDKNKAHHYRFASKAVDFMICTECGVMPCAITRIEEHDYAVININTAQADFAEAHTPLDFSHENAAQSLQRRKQNWIANVRIL